MSLSIAGKHRICREVVASLSKIKFYEDSVKAIKKDFNSLLDADIQIRVKGIKNTIWVRLSPQECISVLTKKIKEEMVVLKQNEAKIK